jgi:hypothetical protein
MRDLKYRRWVAYHWCCIDLEAYEKGTTGVGPHFSFAVSQAAHTENNGTSSKGLDSSCVPLCVMHHAEYDKGRKAFEARYSVDLLAIAKLYYARYLEETQKSNP